MIKITLYNGGLDFGKASPIHLETFPYFETEEMLPSTECTILKSKSKLSLPGCHSMRLSDSGRWSPLQT